MRAFARTVWMHGLLIKGLLAADYAMILFPKRGAEHFTGLIQGLTMREVTTGEEVQVAFEFVTVSE